MNQSPVSRSELNILFKGNKASAGGCEGDMKRTRAVDNCDDLGDDCISESSNGVKMTVCCCDTDLYDISNIYFVYFNFIFSGVTVPQYFLSA